MELVAVNNSIISDVCWAPIKFKIIHYYKQKKNNLKGHTDNNGIAPEAMVLFPVI